MKKFKNEGWSLKKTQKQRKCHFFNKFISLLDCLLIWNPLEPLICGPELAQKLTVCNLFFHMYLTSAFLLLLLTLVSRWNNLGKPEERWPENIRQYVKCFCMCIFSSACLTGLRKLQDMKITQQVLDVNSGPATVWLVLLSH